MRELQYAVEGKAANNSAFAMDEPTWGACHRYRIVGEGVSAGIPVAFELLHVMFQNGPINKAGVNGVENEDLLAILIDRLEGFQSGPYACDENADALAYCKAALQSLIVRTRKRIARGVEGAHKV